MTTYITKPVFIVKDRDDGHIIKTFGIEAEAEKYASTIPTSVIDEWPTEFEVK